MTSEVIDRRRGLDIHGGILNQKEVAMTASASHPFLRRALLLDAAASGLTGALMIGGASVLQDLLALPAGLLRGAGLILVPYVAFVVMVASRTPISVGAVWTVIVCNGLWAAASVALVVDGVVAPNALGTTFVIGQGLAVAALGLLQYVALSRPQSSLA